MADLKPPPPPTPTGDARRVVDGPCAGCWQTRPRFALLVALPAERHTALLCPRCWSDRREDRE